MVVSGVRVNFKQEHNIHLNRHCCSHNSGLTAVVNECCLFITSVLGIALTMLMSSVQILQTCNVTKNGDLKYMHRNGVQIRPQPNSDINDISSSQLTHFKLCND